jgi:hypothetical protein
MTCPICNATSPDADRCPVCGGAVSIDRWARPDVGGPFRGAPPSATAPIPSTKSGSPRSLILAVAILGALLMAGVTYFLRSRGLR